jgi:hypothetical protein
VTDSRSTQTRVYRVTVRGQFAGLSERSKTWLIQAADEHDIFLSSFTEEGTFTYDRRLHAFNLRYEVRLGRSEGEATTDSPANDPAEEGLLRARLFLRTMGIGHGPLRAAVMDMSAMTERAQQR